MVRPQRFTILDRCYAVMGTVHTGPLYCGNPKKFILADGRPVCGVHRNKKSMPKWDGVVSEYPHGTKGNWRFLLPDGRDNNPSSLPDSTREPQ